MARLLIIEDSPTHRAEIRAAVEPSQLFDSILEAEDGLAGLKMLLSETVDVVLCDLHMPGLDGEKLLRIKSQKGVSADIPFLFLSATQNLQQQVRLLDGGACDTISKPFHPSELVARLRLHLKLKRLQDELREKNTMLARLSTTDPVTGLRTRRYATEVLNIEWIRARRYQTPLAVMMADLDHFKHVNDKYGHPAGDAVLRGVSEVLRQTLRAPDVSGRYGGEEILVILPQTELEGAVQVADRWRQAVEAATFRAPDGRSVGVTVSIGVAMFDLAHATAEELVAAADEALYRAKNQGRNRVEASRRAVDGDITGGTAVDGDITGGVGI
ncbi:MAG: diguanylate cyclase [Deltaproteobacteria bacterium]|nr:diguanylate cyclase [Deltaproteobacteria bacterium]MBW2445842.1 diguanylate cyclase [Deltaproteobacteria bacterium]